MSRRKVLGNLFVCVNLLNVGTDNFFMKRSSTLIFIIIRQYKHRRFRNDFLSKKIANNTFFFFVDVKPWVRFVFKYLSVKPIVRMIVKKFSITSWTVSVKLYAAYVKKNRCLMVTWFGIASPFTYSRYWFLQANAFIYLCVWFRYMSRYHDYFNLDFFSTLVIYIFLFF